jgi:hypothetical protein
MRCMLELGSWRVPFAILATFEYRGSLLTHAHATYPWIHRQCCPDQARLVGFLGSLPRCLFQRSQGTTAAL